MPFLVQQRFGLITTDDPQGTVRYWPEPASGRPISKAIGADRQRMMRADGRLSRPSPLRF